MLALSFNQYFFSVEQKLIAVNFNKSLYRKTKQNKIFFYKSKTREIAPHLMRHTDSIVIARMRSRDVFKSTFLQNKILDIF